MNTNLLSRTAIALTALGMVGCASSLPHRDAVAGADTSPPTTETATPYAAAASADLGPPVVDISQPFGERVAQSPTDPQAVAMTSQQPPVVDLSVLASRMDPPVVDLSAAHPALQQPPVVDITAPAPQPGVAASWSDRTTALE